MAEGIEIRHRKGCRSQDEGRCNCSPSYRVHIWSDRDQKRVRKTFSSMTEAKAWRSEASVALDKGILRTPRPTTIAQAWEQWYEGAQAGTIRNRSGDPFKPSALRAYEAAMRVRILPAVGSARLSDLRRPELQELADELQAEGLSASYIQTTFLPLRAIYRRAMKREEVATNPCTGLDLPAIRGRRERFASPDEAAKLIAAAPREDRALWATAFYAGLRLGELRALRAQDVNLAEGVIRVEAGWDPAAGRIPLKSQAGRRRVPIPAVLRDDLLDHLAEVERVGEGLIFGLDPVVPFTPNRVQARADKAWKKAKLERITPHEARHTFASLMIAAGVNAKALSTFMGHSSITITLDRYGHLMPGSEEEAATLLDSYLEAQRERAEDQARSAQQSRKLASA